MKLKRKMSAHRIGATTFLVCLLSLFLQCSLVLPTASAIEATFTPNPQDSVENGGDGGPLPVSMQQRRQLLELDAAIANSQDPSATINHVAQQNGMSPAELAGMLERNRRDLQESGQLEGMVGQVNAAMQAQGGGGGMASASIPRRILSSVASILVALMKTASVQVSRNPRQSTIIAMLLVCSLLAIHNAPRNGIVISSGSFSPLSHGHTTVLDPPIEYLERTCANSWAKGGWTSSLPEPMEVKSKKSSKSKKQSHKFVGGVGMTGSLEIDTSNAQEGEVSVETSLSKEDGFEMVTTAQTLITMDDKIVNGGKEKEAEDESLLELRKEAMDCMHDSIASIFHERKFSEFVPGNSHSLRFRSFLVASGDDEEDATEGAVIAMKLLGDFGRYGVQPLCISYEMEDENEPMVHCVAFHSLRGGHFDGELRFSVKEKKFDKGKKSKKDSRSKTKEGGPGVVITVTLAIPNGGRAPPVHLAESMVSSLAQSIAQSSQIRIEQTLSRRRQSMSYRAQASGRASLKRHLRYEQEKLQEEMSADRKRKWKRNNPDAG
eukprot:CAMPEP_0172526972 /NCGR_PEP_ID=MMETSP1067-20121228/1791_1 /TAXON_ID=265564 ORGANISM="Thalassiosira punctigera, Strain Tpunct2005C2" /NCGR_SAMPLE_ID=MMETSP1067 /ASSEMBLY_ACC=CAM_ASM_000444 /LENGTH=548 /DNA_ID=CAMNT_0013310621 /DNA_START=35 /DNA_END=1677 /DNA_ORIENTATION=-